MQRRSYRLDSNQPDLENEWNSKMAKNNFQTFSIEKATESFLLAHRTGLFGWSIGHKHDRDSARS